MQVWKKCPDSQVLHSFSVFEIIIKSRIIKKARYTGMSFRLI